GDAPAAPAPAASVRTDAASAPAAPYDDEPPFDFDELEPPWDEEE
ncbi:hypothetical protein GT043_21220, partial [Streptomyces sp. SID2131]|nr:hypothetical protein [Streptomyces sp. SID2131]